MFNEIKKTFDNSAKDYLSNNELSYLKKHSQFFTPDDIAKNMIDMIDLNNLKRYKEIRLLEPSAGFGVLIFHLIAFLALKTKIKKFYIDAYETDLDINSQLIINLQKLSDYVLQKFDIVLETKVYSSDFLLSFDSITNKYNIIVSNPPYKKIVKSSNIAKKFKDYIFGQPNLYSLFIVSCLNLLDQNGELIVLSPRNYLTGLYSKKIRQYIFSNYKLTHLHTFDSRHVFKNISQEVIIAAFANSKNTNSSISVSHNGTFSVQVNFDKLVYSETSSSILIPKSLKDLSILDTRKNFVNTLSSLGYKALVGPVVQFRQKEFLSEEPFSLTRAPFLTTKNIRENNIINYSKNQKSNTILSIKTSSTKLCRNSNYVIVQKVTSKSSKSFIKAAVLHKNMFRSNFIGFDNNLIYIANLSPSANLKITECYGIYCYLMSSYFNEIFSFMISTHTINISDFEMIPFPSRKELIEFGKALIKSNDYSRISCDKIFKKFSNI